MISSKKSLVYKTVPKSWEIKQVKELSTLDKNAVQTGPFGSLLHSSDYVESGIPLILVKNIKNGKIDVRNIPHVTEKDAHRLAKFRVKKGDIVFTRVGRVGTSALIEKEHEGWLISGQTLRIRFDNPKINPKYINYFFQSDVFLDILSKEILGITRDSINTSILAKILVLIPTLLEQQKIVYILSTVDELINKYDNAIQTTNQLKKGLIQKLLTKGIEHKKFKKVKWLFGEEIKIPEAWNCFKIKDVCKKISVGIATSTTKYFVDKGVPLLRNQNIKEGYIETNDLLHISEKFAKMNKSKKLQTGDVVCMRTGYPGQSAVIPTEMNGWHTFTTLIIRPNNLILDSHFLSIFLNSNGRKQITSVQAGAAQQNLNVGWLSHMLIIIPTLKEQHKIILILQNIDSKINNLEFTKTYLKNLKKGLMQKLLTGEIRVSV